MGWLKVIANNLSADLDKAPSDLRQTHKRPRVSCKTDRLAVPIFKRERESWSDRQAHETTARRINSKTFGDEF